MKQLRLFLLFIIAIVLVSCGASDQGQRKVEYVTLDNGQRIPQGGTLVATLVNDVNSLNYYVAETAGAYDIIDLMNVPMLDINPDLKTFIPRLAKSWEFSPDRRELVFHLRDDVYWWDGEKTTAEDVVFTHRFTARMNTPWNGAGWKEHIQKVVAVNDTTVVYHFEQVYPYQLMDAAEGVILPEHIFKDEAPEDIRSSPSNSHPMGNGPFQFKQWSQQQQIELVRNPDYYEENKPHLDRIFFKVIPDQTTSITQLRAGEVDLVQNVIPRTFQEIKEEYNAGNSTLRPYEYVGRSYDFIAWNLIDPEKYDPDIHTTVESFDEIANPFFADSRVRMAMTYAIDRDLLRDAIGYGLLTPLHGAFSPILWAYDPSLPEIPYDPEKAKSLLSEAGWSDADDDGILEKGGTEFRFTLKTNAGNVRREQACTLIQDMLKSVGVVAEIQTVEGVSFFSGLRTKQFDAALMGWSVALKVDLAPIFSRDAALGGFNFTTYRNPEFDQLNDNAVLTNDTEEAKSIWREVELLLREDQPYTWLYNIKSSHVLDGRFRGVIMDHRGVYINLEDWWVPVKERRYWMTGTAS